MHCPETVENAQVWAGRRAWRWVALRKMRCWRRSDDLEHAVLVDCLRTSTRMLQTIQLLSLLTSKLRRLSTRMSLLRSSSSQLHSRSISILPCSWASAASAGRTVYCTVGATNHHRDVIHDLALHSSGRQLVILLIFSNLVSFRHLLAPFAWVLLTPGWRVSPLLLAASVSVLVDSRAPSSRGASPPLPEGRPDPTISTSGSFRSSPLASTTVEPLRSLSECSRCCTSVSTSRLQHLPNSQLQHGETPTTPVQCRTSTTIGSIPSHASHQKRKLEL